MSEENKPGEEEKKNERSSLPSDEFELYFSFIKSLVLDLPSSEDRAIAAAWVQKLEVEPESNEEKKQRLNYVKLLLFVLQRGRLSGIFRNQPPSGPLQPFPQGFSILDMGNWMLDQTDAQTCGAGDTGFAPYTIDVSNDLREFVASQEVPNFGIQMYYAWSSDEPIHKWNFFDEDKFPMYILDKIKQLKEIKSDEKSLASKNLFGMKKKSGAAYQQDKSWKKKVKSPQEIERSQGRSFHTYMGFVGRMGNFNEKCNGDPEKFQRQDLCMKKCLRKSSQAKFPGNGGEADLRLRDDCADFVSNAGGFSSQSRSSPYSYPPQYPPQAGATLPCEELDFSASRDCDNSSRQNNADWDEAEMITMTQRRPKRDTYVENISTQIPQRRLFPPRSRSVSPRCPEMAYGRDGNRGGTPTTGLCVCSSPPCTCPCPRAQQMEGEAEMEPQAVSKPRRQEQTPNDIFGRDNVAYIARQVPSSRQNAPCPRQGPSTRLTPSPRQDTPCPRPDSPHPRKDTPYSRQDSPCPRPDSPHPRQDTPCPRPDSPHPRQDSPYPRQGTPYPRQDTPCPRQDTPCPRQDSPHPRQDTPYPRQDTPCPRQDSPHPRQDTPHPRQDTPYPRQDTPCPRPDSPHPRQDTPHPRQDTPYPRQDTPCPRPDSPHPRQDSPCPRPDSPHPRQGTPYPRQDTPCPRPDSPHPRKDTPYPRQDTPCPRPDSPHPRQDTPCPRPDSPHPRKDTPHPRQGTPHPRQGTPHPRQGTPYPRPDSPYPRQDTLYPRQDTPCPRPGSPYPRPGSPYPRPGSPYPRPDGPYSRQDTPYPLLSPCPRKDDVCQRQDTPCPQSRPGSGRSPNRRQDLSPERTLTAQDSSTAGQPEIVHCYDDQNPDPTLMPNTVTFTKELVIPGTPIPFSGNKYMDASLINTRPVRPKCSTPRKGPSGAEAESSQLLDFDLSPVESQFSSKLQCPAAPEDEPIYLFASPQKAYTSPYKNQPPPPGSPAQFMTMDEDESTDTTLTETLMKNGTKPKSASPCYGGSSAQAAGSGGRLTNMANVLEGLKQKAEAHREKCEAAGFRKSPSPQPSAACAGRSPRTQGTRLNDEEIPSGFATDTTFKKVQSRPSSKQSPKEQKEAWQLPVAKGKSPQSFSDTLTPQHPQEACQQGTYPAEQQNFEEPCFEELEDEEPEPTLICPANSPAGRPPAQGSVQQGGISSTPPHAGKSSYKKKYKDNAHYVMEGSYLNNLEACGPQPTNQQWQSPPEHMKVVRRLNFSDLDAFEMNSPTLPTNTSPSANISTPPPLNNCYAERRLQQDGRQQKDGGPPEFMIASPQASARPTNVQQGDYRGTEFLEPGPQTRTWQPMKAAAVIDEIPDSEAQWTPMRASQRSRGTLNLLEPPPFPQETGRSKISPLRFCQEEGNEIVEGRNQQYARQPRNLNRTAEHVITSYASSSRSPQVSFGQTQGNQRWVSPKPIYIDPSDPSSWTSPIVMRNAMVQEEVDNGNNRYGFSDRAECDLEEPVFAQETNRVDDAHYLQNFAEDNQVCGAEDYPVENPNICPDIQEVTRPQNVTPCNTRPPPFYPALPMSRPQRIFSPVSTPPSMGCRMENVAYSP